MSYLKSVGTSFVYIVFVLALITFSPGLEPAEEFAEYSSKPPAELIGVFAPNERLNNPELLLNGEIKGPESFDSYNGELYTGLHGGYVAKIVGKKIVPLVKFGKDCAGLWEEDKCGRPLGLKFDKQGRLYVADAYYGIFKVNVESGKYTRLFNPADAIDGVVPKIFNSIDIADNGDVYWTDSSSQYDLKDGLVTMFTDPAGRLIRYNAATKKNEVLLKNLNFPNGLKISDDESYVIVAETFNLSILKYHLKGSKAGSSEVFVDGLPGTPDNVHSDGQGNYLVSIVGPADPEHPIITQSLQPHPYLRKLVARVLRLLELPFALVDKVYPNDFAKKTIHKLGHFEMAGTLMQPKVTVLRIDGAGKILDALHNSDEKFGGVSSAYILNDYLWLGSPFNEFLARIPLKQAFPGTKFVTKTAEKPRVVAREPEIEKPAVAPKVTATPKPPAKDIPARAEAPKVAKVEKVKPAAKVAEKETEKKQQAGNIPKKVIETAEAPKKAEPVKATNELPKPIKQAEPAKPSKASKQPEAAKAPKKAEPTKRNTKLADEI